MKASQRLFGLLALAAIGVTGHSLASDNKQPVVVELFTSQGCSSCPPANANLISLSARDDVLVLSFAVTYWDYLGWKDIFGRLEYTDRQRTYEPALGQQGPFTPQMVVNGATTAVGNNLAEIERLITAAQPTTTTVTLGQGRVEIGQGDAPSGGADVWLVRFDPTVVEVPVPRGENTGRTLPHTHVVHLLQRLGEWQGGVARFETGEDVAGLRTAVLVQQRNGGPIIGAASN